MAESPTAHSGHLLRIRITSNGTPLSDTVQVISVTVHTLINKIPFAEIVLVDGDMPSQEFPVSDGETFTPGAAIVIEAGYDDTSEAIFSGVVIRHGLRIAGSNQAQLVIECRDKAVAMTIGRKNVNYVDQKDSDVFTTILGSYKGISSEVSSTECQHPELVQHYCTDWDFLVARAEVNGMLVLAGQNKVTVQAPKTDGEAQLTVQYGLDLIEFRADVDSRTQLSSVKAVSWDPKSQAIVSQTADPKTLNEQGDLKSETLAQVVGPDSYRLQTPVPIDQSEVKAWADSQQVKSALSRIRGSMRFQGSAKAKIGTLIEAKGVGNRFSGNVFVCGVRHEIADGNWWTQVDFGMPFAWFADKRDLVVPPASGLLPGVEGLQLAVVKKLDEDPEAGKRVQVSIPLLEAQGDGVWARLSNFYASSGFGDFFIPEVGDEVVLGYLNNDPSNPIILGSLYSASRVPPYELTTENNTKAIVTRSKLRLIFDEEKKSVTIITPASNKVVISDDTKSILLQDQNGNKAELSPTGILLDSPKDITVNAKGKIAMSAAMEISMAAQMDVKVSGLNISNTAQVGFTAKGAATAELSASGQTTVRGALVMIN